MIDLTNAPEGAAHYNKINEYFYKAIKDGFLVHGGRDIDGGEIWGFSFVGSKNANVLEINNGWTIYNNDKPLSELSDEQRGLLFNHWCNGGGICGGFSECDIKTPRWTPTETYRAKQKTERELFIDKVEAHFGDLLPIQKSLVEAMFNAGFKAPKVGE